MTGTVTDPTGAVIARAGVTMTRTGTDYKRTATTNEAGQFTIPSLPPSTYRMSVEAPGFKVYTQEVTLLADQSGFFANPDATRFGNRERQRGGDIHSGQHRDACAQPGD